MPQFSDRSKNKLAQCCPELQMLFGTVIRYYDCTILCGHRSQAEQDEAYRTGKSKLQWPGSAHNDRPSGAIDVVPYPISWSTDPNNMARFYHFAGFVKGIALTMGYKIKWGGDWDSDHDFSDQNFNDLPHFEYVGPV